ncbi:MAG: heme-binding protein [Ktedonobacteraceae bacterium]|nr:heme-binding protein [Ktedonobacteraceae bacterium]MBO0796109.1 heme-binding protein [Ktedonobacteraceae bacterium]
MSISIDLARRIVEASKQRARELRSPVSIAVVDAGGHLVLFERMMAPYGWATGNISLAKATTAVMFNQSTDAIAQWGSSIPGFASSMASMTDGKFIMAAGGWPIRVNGATVGGIGISGGNAPGRDDEIARAGLAAIDMAPIAPPQHVAPAQPYGAPPQVPAYTPPLANQFERPLVERAPFETAGTASAEASNYTGHLPNDRESVPRGEPSEQFQDEHPGDHS